MQGLLLSLTAGEASPNYLLYFLIGGAAVLAVIAFVLWRQKYKQDGEQ